MKTWGLSPAESNQELPSGLFDYLQNNSQLQVWCVPDSHYETTLKRSAGPGFGLVCKQRQTSGGSAGWRSCVPLGPRQRGAEQPSAFWPNGAFLFFKQFILCGSSISPAHLRIQHRNRIQDSFSKGGWWEVRCGSNLYRELPEQTPNPIVPGAAQSEGTEPPPGPHCSKPH